MADALKYYQTAYHHVERMTRGYKSLMSKINIPKTGQLSVIDIGVGSGKISNEVVIPLLPENVSEIVFSDIDDRMLEFTRSITKDPRVSFEQLNIEGESVPEHLQGRFDLSFSSYCFSLIKDLRKGFKNTGDLLKPGGHLLNMFQYKNEELFTTYRRMSQMDKWRKYMEDYANFTTHLSGPNPEEELKKIFEEIGMTLVEYDFDPDYYMDMTKREVLDSWRALDKKYLHLIPKDLQEDYMKDFLRIFSEEAKIDFVDVDLDEQVNYSFPTVSVHAKK